MNLKHHSRSNSSHSVHRRLCLWFISIQPQLQPLQCSDLQVGIDAIHTHYALTQYSLCPTNATVPIEASGIIPVSQSDVAGIPSIALSIPDFEGQAILRLFANSTQSEIGCYSGVITNGSTFSQPKTVGSILGVFTFVAIVASFATAFYGNHIPTTRTHYAHSLSILVVFSVFHHIFFTGALSVNWPSVLPAFWSNFAWSTGMIYSSKMQNSINTLIGSNRGNISIVGAAGPGAESDSIGGGYAISQIYKRTFADIFRRDVTSPSGRLGMLGTKRLEHALAKRDGALATAADGYSWYGSPVKPGLPLPGNFSGFAGTLAEEDIPASNAFMTGFLWFLILIVLVAASVVGFKWLLEGLSRTKLVKRDQLAFFRAHWLGYTVMAVLRTMLIGFFMMVFLTLFQFTYKGSAGVLAIAVIVFLIFFIGLFGIAGYACFYRLRFGRYKTVPDRLHVEKRKALGCIPWIGFGTEKHRSEKAELRPSAGSLPWWRIDYIDQDTQRVSVHEDEDYNMKFGWLSARFRRTRWWFFACWLLYEFIRACFYGGAAGHPMTQVFGLLVVEFIALVIIIAMKPFEGARLNALMVYVLGFSKVATLALSAAFDIRFNLPRIITTAIGIVIIVIQGILTMLLLIAIVVGVISSYISVTRDHEEIYPKSWAPLRQKYFAHLEKTAPDVPPPPPPEPEEPKEPYFNVASVRRVAKIEDEDEDYVDETNPMASRTSLAGPTTRGSRANSMFSQTSHHNVPFGARVHRASWSSKDFNTWNEAGNRSSQLMSRVSLHNKPSDPSLNENISPFLPRPASRAPVRSQTPRSSSGPLDVRKSRNGKEREVVEEGSEEQT